MNCLLTERSVKGINASYRKCLLIMDLLCILHNILFRKTSFKLSQSWQFIKATGNASSSAGLTFIPFYISIIFTVHIVYHYQLLAGRNWICSYMFSCYSQSFKFFVHRHHAWISSQNSCQLINISCRQCPHVRGEKDSL